MRCVARFALIALGFAALPLLAWGGDKGPIAIPGPGQGYQLSPPNDTHENAPPGYEGRTDNSSQTATGNTPATAGKTIVSHFTFGNQIRTCPDTDGKAEGTGKFLVSIDYTDAQADSTSTMHIEMRAGAKYKGQVGDDAYLSGPVNAEVDYTYSLSSSTRDRNGAKTNVTPINVPQHITIPVLVIKGMTPPDLGPFSGGDPAQAHYADALGVGAALTYWGGVYYSIAETKWLMGQCVQVAFDPSGNTSQPPLGAETTVNAEVKTKGGESVPAHFQDAHAYSGGMVSPNFGKSDIGTPMQFTYTAPNKKVPHPGFGVNAVSRAGVAQGEWKPGLGTGWSGQITYLKQYSGDRGHNDLQDWSNSSEERITINVENGVGTEEDYVEEESQSENRQSVFPSGYKKLSSSSSEGSGSGTTPVSVEVRINDAAGTYDIVIGAATGPGGRPIPVSQSLGKTHWTDCDTRGCTSGERDIMLSGMSLTGPLGGKLQDRNHIQASQSTRKENLGRAKNAVMVESMTVNLARSGTTTNRPRASR